MTIGDNFILLILLFGIFITWILSIIVSPLRKNKSDKIFNKYNINITSIVVGIVSMFFGGAVFLFYTIICHDANSQYVYVSSIYNPFIVMFLATFIPSIFFKFIIFG